MVSTKRDPNKEAGGARRRSGGRARSGLQNLYGELHKPCDPGETTICAGASSSNLRVVTKIEVRYSQRSQNGRKDFSNLTEVLNMKRLERTSCH